MSSSAAGRQELPPEGGYRKFNFHRTFPKTVWRPGVVVGVLFTATSYGSYTAIQRLRAMVTEKFEDVDLNNAMEPFLKAERDRFWLKLLAKNRELEEKIMKDVPGWKTGTWYGEPVYLTLGDKWWDPGYREVFAHSDYTQLMQEHTWRHHSEYAGPKFYDNWIPKSISRWIW